MGYFLLTLSRSKFQSSVAGRLLVTGFIALGFRLILLFCFLVMDFDPQARRRALDRQRNLKVVQQLFKPSLSWYIYIPIYSKQTSLSDFNIFHVFLIPFVILFILYPFFVSFHPRNHIFSSPLFLPRTISRTALGTLNSATLCTARTKTRNPVDSLATAFNIGDSDKSWDSGELSNHEWINGFRGIFTYAGSR